MKSGGESQCITPLFETLGTTCQLRMLCFWWVTYIHAWSFIVMKTTISWFQATWFAASPQRFAPCVQWAHLCTFFQHFCGLTFGSRLSSTLILSMLYILLGLSRRSFPSTVFSCCFIYAFKIKCFCHWVFYIIMMCISWTAHELYFVGW